MSKFTKGPWLTQEENNNAIHFWSIQSKNGEQIGDCLMEANARLITAAPEMYEMLDKLVEAINSVDTVNGLFSFGIVKIRPELVKDTKELLARIDGEEHHE